MKETSALKKQSIEILEKFNIEKTPDNIEFVINSLKNVLGGRKSEKIVSFDLDGNQINIHNTLIEAAEYFETYHQLVSRSCNNHNLIPNIGIRFRKLSHFGNLKRKDLKITKAIR